MSAILGSRSQVPTRLPVEAARTTNYADSRASAYSLLKGQQRKQRCSCAADFGPAITRNTSASLIADASAVGQRSQRVCPVCKGTGFKPCGQCEGTGINQEDKFGGTYRKGDPCWLCEGKARSMCGNCADLTDTF
eukprot:CAMPEP_0177777028 /NCGR_PEP_ID=MMETSP0491_2-20121128/15050_1 /TAXON_ID=63592 /ORGANISM="Tetraselmis chuii, Strain PLY429" /LENGTH=134 /DNA_ID=CAMNT_0019295903 /DNA_START=99 /DNA_END=503 /DNA_ORIENTATION=+